MTRVGESGSRVTERYHELLGHEPSFAASATSRQFGTFNVDKVRTAVITCRLTYGSSSSSGAVLNLYYSPDGENWDTVPYLSYTINLTASGTIQESKILDVPEVGYLKAELVNGAGDTSTEAFIWVTKRRWIGV